MRGDYASRRALRGSRGKTTRPGVPGGAGRPGGGAPPAGVAAVGSRQRPVCGGNQGRSVGVPGAGRRREPELLPPAPLPRRGPPAPLGQREAGSEPGGTNRGPEGAQARALGTRGG